MLGWILLGLFWDNISLNWIHLSSFPHIGGSWPLQLHFRCFPQYILHGLRWSLRCMRRFRRRRRLIDVHGFGVSILTYTALNCRIKLSIAKCLNR